VRGTFVHGLSYDAAIAMTDAELLQRTYEWVGRVQDLDGDAIAGPQCVADALYFLVGELAERFCPELERAEQERGVREVFADDPEHSALELADSLTHFRGRQAARMLRDAL
jgi:hypothetical protein